MKHETAENLVRSGVAATGAVTTYGLQEINTMVAIIVGVATFLYVIINSVFLLRKWYKLEKHGWHSEKGN